MNKTRLAFVSLVVVGTVVATYFYSHILFDNEWNVFELCSLFLFITLFAWISQGFWTAFIGFFRSMASADTQNDGRFRWLANQNDWVPSRTAIVMPVYNEDPCRVIAGLRATIRSLCETGMGSTFDVFILSDTRDANGWLAEEKAWLWLTKECPEIGIYYRHRPENKSRKSGNISEFCRRWGASYQHMVVLDADSIMDGQTLVELVFRMDQDPEIGILQVPPKPVNRHSFFARLQQFASGIYGPVFIRGFSAWTGRDGNYWGHNAIIRIDPFMQHCDLPTLSGQAPLGGEILSHDFVEAALMSRAGWKVEIADDLDGSYEECPTTLLDYVIRDQRWCQGNLQHGRLLLCEGFRPMSRAHFAMGVLSYLAAPLWLLFVVTNLLGMAHETEPISGEASYTTWVLFAVSMTMLLLPKVFGLAVALRSAFGKRGFLTRSISLTASVLLETVMSVVIAPLMAIYHTQFVLTTLAGHSVRWNTQQRDESGVALRDAVKRYALHTFLGLLVVATTAIVAPSLLPWILLGFGGLLVSIPLAVALASVKFGRLLASWRLLTIEEELALPPVLTEFRECLELTTEMAKENTSHESFLATVYEKDAIDLHAHILRETRSVVSTSVDDVQSLLAIAQSDGIDAIPADKRCAILSDDQAMLQLHQSIQAPKPAATR